jgi:hypothetical protein
MDKRFPHFQLFRIYQRRIRLVFLIGTDLVLVKKRMQNQASASCADHSSVLAAVHGQGANRSVIGFRQRIEQQGVRLLATAIWSGVIRGLEEDPRRSR